MEFIIITDKTNLDDPSNEAQIGFAIRKVAFEEAIDLRELFSSSLAAIAKF